jgi:carbamate kinase
MKFKVLAKKDMPLEMRIMREAAIKPISRVLEQDQRALELIMALVFDQHLIATDIAKSVVNSLTPEESDLVEAYVAACTAHGKRH